jgi:hypothetical protein
MTIKELSHRADLIDFYTQTIGYVPDVYRLETVNGVGCGV